jgi:chemotaxis protein MotB
MKKLILLGVSSMIVLSSCVSKKKYAALEDQLNEMNQVAEQLNTCKNDVAAANAKVDAMKDQIADLRDANKELIQTQGDFLSLTKKGAENLEKSLESLQERDLKINKLQDAINKKDSIALAVVSSIKSSVGMDNTNINVNVKGGRVFISIADQLLFKSGSFTVNSAAKEVLGDVAKILKDKSNFEAMVESHTDDKSYAKGVLVDNWDLSVKRATSIVRTLEGLGVDSKQLVAAGRGETTPLVDNDTKENRAKNRRTEIVIMPKVDDFYEMVDNELKNLSGEKVEEAPAQEEVKEEAAE